MECKGWLFIFYAIVNSVNFLTWSDSVSKNNLTPFLLIWQLLRYIFYEISKVAVLTASMLKWAFKLLVKTNQSLFYISKFETFRRSQPFSFTKILTICDSFSVKVTLCVSKPCALTSNRCQQMKIDWNESIKVGVH